jgi:nucleotide-binding universal stress UspA family protein
MKNRIGVALDGGEESTAILQAVAPLARALEASIALMSAIDRPDIPARRGPWLEAVAKGLREQGLETTVELRIGQPAEEILAFARERAPLFLAMTTHGRRGMDRLILGSVVEEVLRRSELPLLIARPDTAGERGEAILVALDGSRLAEEILPDVARLAKATGRPVEVARAMLPVVTAGGLGEFPMYFPQEDPAPYLDDVCTLLAAEGVTAAPVALAGRAGSSLLTYAAGSNASLIALTTHGRSGLRRVLMGSIAEEILRTAPCPVLVRRSADKKKGR